jgi:hypothetical protein
MLIPFFGIKGTVHSEFIPQGKTLNQAYYVEMLKQLREAVRRKMSDWILRHDNAPAHKALSRSFWPKNPLLKCNIHPIPLTLFRMTPSCFQKSCLP